MDIDSHPHPLNEDSDTGLESMSSAETPHKVAAACPLCGGQEESTCALHADPEAVLRQVEALKQEINKLKCDKLDLLRQNVVSWCCCGSYLSSSLFSSFVFHPTNSSSHLTSHLRFYFILFYLFIYYFFFLQVTRSLEHFPWCLVSQTSSPISSFFLKLFLQFVSLHSS